ncbi:glycoside hydrolase [Obba rivulosa]|uniref:Glycoside hydrolase n=1 Tax=Obba rivulosa TaxID=1052685 RepID=A0A8E2DT89_9APHY|nr:glycoside hydrolase [Obba rivulosa]
MLPFLLSLLCCLFCIAVRSCAADQQCMLVSHLPQTGTNDRNTSSQTPPSGTSSSTTSSSNTSTASDGSGSPPPLAPFAYGQDVIRGVNLGGWFVLEPWITPSIFESTNNTDIVDEFTFGQLLDNETALSILQSHWETWYTEDDFVAMRAAGLNHVRIPVGYWSVPITSADTNSSTSVSPYVPGAWPYVLQALNWAKNNSLHVIFDLHGAPGSQNGFDNSGQRTDTPEWANGNANISRTLDIIKFISENVGGMIDVLELLNEPAAYVSNIDAALPQYWQQGYGVVRQAAGSDIQVMIEDGFLGVQSWENFLLYPEAEGVIMDTHEYQIFNYDQLGLSFQGHINASCQQAGSLASYAKSNLYTIIGEWSTAVTDCAKWLNGRGIGARWDGTWQPNQQVFGSCDGWTGNMSTFSAEYKTFLRQYWEVQVQMGEAIQGWVYWTWKAENADEWSYQKGLEGGWIPQDPTDLMYPDICSSL